MFGNRKERPKTGRKKDICITIDAGDVRIYRGPLEDIPLDEEVVIQKSVEFFNDPEPCYIHRGGVRLKLTGELKECFKNGTSPDSAEGLEKLREYCACPEITSVTFEDPEASEQ